MSINFGKNWIKYFRNGNSFDTCESLYIFASTTHNVKNIEKYFMKTRSNITTKQERQFNSIFLTNFKVAGLIDAILKIHSFYSFNFFNMIYGNVNHAQTLWKYEMEFPRIRVCYNSMCLFFDLCLHHKHTTIP